MDSEKKFQIDPLPLEKEFKVLSIRRRLNELSRDELEEFLTESLTLLTKMSHQMEAMRDHIEFIEGKSD